MKPFYALRTRSQNDELRLIEVFVRSLKFHFQADSKVMQVNELPAIEVPSNSLAIVSKAE